MASVTPVQEIQEETKCPICLEYLTDPVTINRGHNFCRGCITQHCKSWAEGDYDHLCYPSCRAPIRKGTLQNNYQLANIVEKIKQLPLGTGNKNLCVRHQEKLNLFCEEDWEAVCVLCERSLEHRSHTVLLMEEAAQKYMEKIQAHLKTLREEREKLLGFKMAGEWKSQEYLDVRSTLSRCEKGKFQQPVEISQKSIALMEALRKFKDTLPSELKTKRGGSLGAHIQVNMSLDSDTAHPDLVLSEDQKSVRCGHARQDLLNNPERFDTELCVLGCEGFTSGRHSWEVEVGDRGSWSVGVARESVRRKRWISLNPEEGIWAVEWCWWGQFWALTSPVTPLPLSREPKRIRVCLDCKRGQVTFFDAGNEAPIFTFPLASVPGERIHPWLRVGAGAQLRLCP